MSEKLYEMSAPHASSMPKLLESLATSQKTPSILTICSKIDRKAFRAPIPRNCH